MRTVICGHCDKEFCLSWNYKGKIPLCAVCRTLQKMHDDVERHGRYRAEELRCAWMRAEKAAAEKADAEWTRLDAAEETAAAELEAAEALAERIAAKRAAAERERKAAAERRCKAAAKKADAEYAAAERERNAAIKKATAERIAAKRDAVEEADNVNLDNRSFENCQIATLVNANNPALRYLVITLSLRKPDNTFLSVADFRWETTTVVYSAREMSPEVELDQAWVETQTPIETRPKPKDWKIGHEEHHNTVVLSLCM